MSPPPEPVRLPSVPDNSGAECRGQLPALPHKPVKIQCQTDAYTASAPADTSHITGSATDKRMYKKSCCRLADTGAGSDPGTRNNMTGQPEACSAIPHDASRQRKWSSYIPYSSWNRRPDTRVQKYYKEGLLYILM